MQPTGHLLIGGQGVRGTLGGFQAWDPAAGAALDPVFGGGTTDHVERACALANEAFQSFRSGDPGQRAALLEAIASRINGLGDDLIERAQRETGLTSASRPPSAPRRWPCAARVRSPARSRSTSETTTLQ